FHLAPSPAGLSPPSLHDALPIFVELAAVVDELPVAEEGSFGRAAGGLAGSLHARLARREPVGPGLTIHLTLDVGLRLAAPLAARSEEHTSELQSRENLVCRLLLE